MKIREEKGRKGVGREIWKEEKGSRDIEEIVNKEEREKLNKGKTEKNKG